MTLISHSFDKYIGKVLKEVADDLQAEAKRHGYTFSVMDKSFSENIDLDPKRLNAFVDDDFKIKRIWIA